MKTAYTYTVLRYVHDVATGEFLNVGLALYAPEAKYLSAICRTKYGRVKQVFPCIDVESFKSQMRYIQSRFEQIGGQMRDELDFKHSRTVLDVAQSILAVDDSSLQWSPLGSGLTEDPSATLEQLYIRIVEQYDEVVKNDGRSDSQVWRTYKKSLEEKNLLKYFAPKKIVGRDDEFEFDYAWKNHQWHCLQSTSFDLTSPDSIREKAHRLLGQFSSLRDSKENFKVYLLTGEPQHEKLTGAYERALSILSKAPPELIEVVRENSVSVFSDSLAKKINEHELANGTKTD